MTDNFLKKRFASDHLIIELLMSAMFFFTIASVIILITSYSAVIVVSYPLLLTGLLMSAFYTLVRRFKLKFLPMFLAHIALTALYIYLIQFLVKKGEDKWVTVGYLIVLVIPLFIHSMYQRFHKQTFAIRYDGFIFSMAVQVFVFLFLFFHEFDDAVFMATLNMIMATSCFFIARQIGTLEDKYYHSIRAVATPTKAIKKQNRFITMLILLGIAFSVFMLYIFPMNEALALIRLALAALLGLLIRKPGVSEGEEEVFDRHDVDLGHMQVSPLWQIIENILGVLVTLVLLYALIFSLIALIRSFRNLEIKDKESSSDAVTDVIESIKEETRPGHMDFGSGYEKRIRKKYYRAVKHAMAKGLPIKNSSSPRQIERIIRRSGDESITELTELYEDVRYNR